MKIFISTFFIIGIGVFLFFMQQKKTPSDTISKSQAVPVSQANDSQRSPEQNQPQSAIFNENKPAPELTGITKWLNPNDKPLTLQSLRGKVVLVDFWTNQCINCIRTLPYVTKWYDRYHDQGFVVIGVHTPELQSEYTISSIDEAIKIHNIHYPIAQDNNYTTWNAYSNEYWPGLYLIDKKGIIRRTHFGEGEYEETEQAIKSLIDEASM